MCVVSGPPDCGKSMFLAWLVEHATEPDTEAVRRVHALVPLTGHSTRTAAWQLAEQLQVSARTPGELLSVLARDPRRTVIVLPDLHDSAEPAGIEELACSLVAFAHVRVIVEIRNPSARLLAEEPAVMDLAAPQWTDSDRYAAWAAAGLSARQETTSLPDYRQAPRRWNWTIRRPCAVRTRSPSRLPTRTRRKHTEGFGLPGCDPEPR
ncbi:hypothetical protein HFP43_00300 [Streptomyces sp. SJ1-7]|nr:hypothetical protein [Streptomyces sp. SJ1-7]